MATPVEIRGRWPRVSGESSNTITLGPAALAFPTSLTFLTGGVSLLSYSSENKDIPEHLTLNISVDGLPATAGFLPNYQLVGRLSYGFGKSKTVVYVDLARGIRVTLEASSIDVTVLYFTPSGAGPTLTVSGALAYGGGTNKATFTIFFAPTGSGPQVAAAALSSPTEVPPKAKRVVVFANSGAQNLFDVQQHYSTAPAPPQPPIVDLLAPGNGPIYLAPSADVLRIRNNDAIGHNYVLIYELAL
jgi:hypothetical protein